MARSGEFLRTHESEARGRTAYADAGDDQFDDTSPAEPLGQSYEEEHNWRGAGILSLGIIGGALVGAGLALLLAPHSGEETRDRLVRRARRLGTRADEGWDDLRDE